MDKKQRAMQWLLDRAQRQHRHASMLVARSASALNEARTTEQALQAYLTERNQTRRDANGQMVSVDSVRLSAGFNERLTQAVRQQSETVSKLRSAHAANADVLMNAHRSVKSLEMLRDLRRRRVNVSRRLAEQRESDEWVSGRYHAGLTEQREPWND